MTDLYIYYRIHAAQRETARRSATALLVRVAEASGVRGRLQQRADDPLTWMEIYPGITDAAAFIDSLDALVRESGLSACLDGARHVEHFVECA